MSTETNSVHGSRIAKFKIGDELFRYIEGGGVFRYVVTGRREYPEGAQLEVECKTCSHGWQCQLLIAENDYGKIVAVHMLNNDEEDDQRHWHSNEGHYFVSTIEEAKAGKVAKLIRDAEQRVVDARGALKVAEQRLTELRGLDQGAQV